MKFKLLALDIDDTVVPALSNTISSAVYHELQRVSKKIAISFVTARSINEFRTFLDVLDLPKNYQVVENGAKLLHPDGTVMHNFQISSPEVQTILDVARPFSTLPGFLDDSSWNDTLGNWDTKSHVTGLCFTCENQLLAHDLKEAIHKKSLEYTVYIGNHWTGHKERRGVLVFHKEATKGNGMRCIQKKLGIKPEETIAIGDGMTDLSMFEVAGLRVAMENGEESLKKHADIICPDVRKDGIVEVLQKIIRE